MMKKNVLFAFAALIAVSSCTSEINEEGFVDKANSISFNAYSNKSRAEGGATGTQGVNSDVTTTNMYLDNFGVVGYTVNNHNIYLYKKDNTDNKAVEQKWVGENGTNGSWEYADMGDLKFWPNTAMDFYAYFPYSDKATFAANNATNESSTSVTVMSIPDVDCTHDVLFAYDGNRSQISRVPLTFHHAFAKMMTLTISMPNDGMLYKSGCQIKVQKVEFINTSTKGSINVDNAGKATYTVGSSDETLNETLTSVVTVNKTNTTGKLIDNGTNAKGYFFATNTNEVNNVTGTKKTMWNGQNNTFSESDKLSNKGYVCLKLTCKVWNGADDDKYYYVGDDNNYGEIYIPLKGTDTNLNTVSTFDAGKRYNYTIEMKNNVGYDDNGDPILTPILFEVKSVANWETVNVTVTL